MSPSDNRTLSQGTGAALHADLAARITGGTAQGQITYYSKQQGYDAQLHAANLHLEQIRTLHDRNLEAAGTLTLTASGRGTLQDPQGQMSLTIPQLEIQKQQIRNLNLQASVANHQATFALDSQVLNNPLHAQGKVALTGDYYADANLDTPIRCAHFSSLVKSRALELIFAFKAAYRWRVTLPRLSLCGVRLI